jgi:shikimate dehydrogenase
MSARRFAVIGDPIGHSKSPVMQGAAMRALGLPHSYEAVRVTVDDLPAIIARLRAGEYDGFNVTVPHKERVLSLVDALDESARVAGAANTLVRTSDGRIVAHNTDAPALAAELSELAGSRGQWPATSPRGWPTSARALVLGSGGAARAAVAALGAHLGVREIAVRARAFADPIRRDAFVRTAPYPVVAEPWEPSVEGEKRTFALVQATSAGMRGADDGASVARVVAWDALQPVAVAIDVVYAPRNTPWLAAARRRGLRCDDGLGMLARQGALALELWLAADGVKAPLQAMRAALE